MKSQDGIPILKGNDNMLSMGMDKEELQPILNEIDILKEHRSLSTGYDWYDLWICPTEERFLASLCFNPSEKLETIILYPFIKRTGIPQSWDSATEEYLITNKEICEEWLRSNATMSILARAEIFMDKRDWSTGILIR